MIKVLRVITRLNVGGPSKQVTVLSKLFDEENISQLIVTGSVSDSEQEIDVSQFKDRIIRVKQLSREINLVQDLVAFIKICRIIVRYKPDIIHTHLSKAWTISIFAKIFCRSRAVIIHTFHGQILHSYFSETKTFLFTVVQKFLSNHTDVLVTLNMSNRESLIKAGIGQKSKYISIKPGFKPFNRISKEISRNYLGLNSTKFTVGFIGRFEKIKRTDLLADIIILCHKENINIQFLTCGNGSEFEEFKERTKKYNVVNCSWTTNPEDFYSAIDLLILVSENEGTPLVIIESGLLGIPTLSRDIGGVSDVIKDKVTGFISGNNPVSIVKDLQSILSKPDMYLRVSNQVAAEFNDKYSEAKFLAAYKTLYESSFRKIL